MIEARNIEKSYGSELVLKGVSLKVNKGEFVSIMGESGSGKSTLLSIVAGLTRPSAGQAVLPEDCRILRRNCHLHP